MPPLEAIARTDTVARLLRWRPERGVLSLYIDVDPADRGEGWRIELRNGLDAVVRDARRDGDRDTRLAVEVTAKRVEREIPEPGDGRARGFIGFLEASQKDGGGRWYASQLPLPRSRVSHGPVAHVHPLLELLDDGAPIGVAAVSAERVRLLHWHLGRIEQINDWEFEYLGEDWRERKARRSRDPAGEAVSASGRDQHDQRMEANRERFVEQAGTLTAEEAKRRGWRTLLVFGDERYARPLETGFKGGSELRHAGAADLISEPTSRIERRVEELLPSLNREREGALIERIKEAAYSEGRSALGLQETVQALVEGRVEHLVYDADRDYDRVDPSVGAGMPADLSPIDGMIEMALSTGAAITPVEAESAEALAEQGGVAALLRY